MSDQSPKCPKRFEVLDEDRRVCVSFDATGADQWGPVEYGEDWDSLEDMYRYSVEESLHRHRSGRGSNWTLVSERCFEMGLGTTPSEIGSARRLDEKDAVAWLVRHHQCIPEELERLATQFFFAPGPPQGKSEPPPPVENDQTVEGESPPGEIQAAPDETTADGPQAGKRRGRLPKAESDAKRADLLATLRKHPSLKDDVGKLAGTVGVGESTVRRWLDEEERNYKASKAASPEPAEE